VAPARAVAPAGAPPGWSQALLAAAGEAAADARAAVAYAPDPDAYFRGEDPLALMRAVPDLRWLELDRTAAGPPGPEDSPFVCGLVLRALSAAEPEDVRAVFRRVGDQAQVVPLAPVRPAAPAARAPGRTVRVDAAGLAAVSELVDELIIAKNVLAHETAQALGEGASQGVAAAQLALERAVTALHGAVGRITLAPLGRLFSRLPRQVREMAEAVGKEVELAVTGEDVVVDKPIMDALYEPLIHLLRNAVDHGLEPPGERRAAGKPARGLIRIAARTHGDTAVIEVTDDGRGLDFRKIRAAAVARGVVSEAAAAALEDREAAELIFASGFSTAREVSDLSGRGVGLDAVRAALAAVGGRIEVDSRPGEGTTMRLIAPFRTVLARVAVLQVGQDRFGAPLEAIREVVRVPRAQVTAVRAGEAVVVREEVIPLLHLGRLLGGGPSAADPLAVLVVDGPDGRVGVAVDRVAESLQAPIQAPSPLLAGLAGLQGSILQGDGRVLLVLDLAGLTS
jgi:two-component system chemotaxis sensor kinase CheA